MLLQSGIYEILYQEKGLIWSWKVVQAQNLLHRLKSAPQTQNRLREAKARPAQHSEHVFATGQDQSHSYFLCTIVRFAENL